VYTILKKYNLEKTSNNFCHQECCEEKLTRLQLFLELVILKTGGVSKLEKSKLGTNIFWKVVGVQGKVSVRKYKIYERLKSDFFLGSFTKGINNVDYMGMIFILIVYRMP